MIEIAITIEGQNGLNWQRWHGERTLKELRQRGLIGGTVVRSFWNASRFQQPALNV